MCSCYVDLVTVVLATAMVLATVLWLLANKVPPKYLSNRIISLHYRDTYLQGGGDKSAMHVRRRRIQTTE